MSEDYLKNRTFDEIRVGDSASLVRTLTEQDLRLFAAVSGDVNPTHVDEKYARHFLSGRLVGHSLWSGALISGVLGTKLPGPGTVYVSQDLRFLGPVHVGDTVTATVTARAKRADGHVVEFDCRCVNQHGEAVAAGVAVVRAGRARPRALPGAPGGGRPGAQQVQGAARSLLRADAGPRGRGLPVRRGVAGGRRRGGRGRADRAGPGRATGPDRRDRRQTRLEHRRVPSRRGHRRSRGRRPRRRAGPQGRGRDAHQGALHTDVLLHEVVQRETGLRTERRLSHAFIMDVPTYYKPLVLTDCAINIYPTLEDKISICQNAIDLAHTLGVALPKVAVLSAVETVNPKITATLEASALCKMADRGQITGGLVDGPLAMDNAISKTAAEVKHIRSEVAGDADVLLVPDLEAGNMLAKQLTFMANADAAGIVLGARVPIVLTSRSDNVQARLASCAVGLLLAHARRTGLPGGGDIKVPNSRGER